MLNIVCLTVQLSQVTTAKNSSQSLIRQGLKAVDRRGRSGFHRANLLGIIPVPLRILAHFAANLPSHTSGYIRSLKDSLFSFETPGRWVYWYHIWKKMWIFNMIKVQVFVGGLSPVSFEPKLVRFLLGPSRIRQVCLNHLLRLLFFLSSNWGNSLSFLPLSTSLCSMTFVMTVNTSFFADATVMFVGYLLLQLSSASLPAFGYEVLVKILLNLSFCVISFSTARQDPVQSLHSVTPLQRVDDHVPTPHVVLGGELEACTYRLTWCPVPMFFANLCLILFHSAFYPSSFSLFL